MASRQAGVHISYLIGAMVVAIGLIIWVVLAYNENQQNLEKIARYEDEKTTNEKKRRDLTADRNELRELLHGSDNPVDKDAIRAQFAEYNQLLKDDLGVSYTHFSELLGDTGTLLKQIKDAKTRAEAEAESQGIRADSAVNEQNELDSMLKGKITDKENEINALQQKIEETKKNAADQIAELRDQMEELSEDSQAEIASLTNQLWIKDNKLNIALDRIEQLEGEINKERDYDQVDPDGSVVRVSTDLGFVWIDLGRDQRLRRGLIFDVFQYVKGSKKLRKGKIEVIKVDDKMAETRIVSQVDPTNPISEGDLIACPFYSAKDTPVFVIAGDKPENKRISIEEIERKIQSFGGKLEAQVNIKTTYVVALEGYETSPAYKEARKLGVTILREMDFLEFIGYTNNR